MKNPKLSIIVPVYNTAEYLPECLDCFLSQTYQNFEVILVDDGSPDNSGKICDEYAKKDGRFRVIHQKNQGVSAARNAGLDVAEGDYVGFVDSDDTFLPELYADFAKIIEDESPDMVQSIGMVVDGYPKVDNPVIYTFDNEEARGEFFRIGKIRPSVWLALIKKEIIGSLRFPSNIHQWEDYAYIAVMVSRSNKVVVTSNRYYIYREREGSATNRPLNDRQMTCLLIDEYLQNLGVYNKQQEQYDVAGFFVRCACTNYIQHTPADKKKFKDVIISEIRKNNEALRKCKSVPLRVKVIVYSFLISEYLAKCLFVIERLAVKFLIKQRDLLRRILRSS